MPSRRKGLRKASLKMSTNAIHRGAGGGGVAGGGGQDVVSLLRWR